VNKLWNVGRLVIARTTAEQRRHALEPAIPRADAALAERWMASRLAFVTSEATRLLGEFNFGEAGRLIHDFIWDELADWYLEAYKILAPSGQADGALLAQVYDKVLRLLHPFAPFVTEELWQRLTTGVASRPIALMMAEWPTPGPRDEAAEDAFADVIALTRAARTLRSDYRIEPARSIPATIAAPNAERLAFWRANADLVASLPGTRLAPIEIVDNASPELASRSIAAVAAGVELLIPAEGLFDVHQERQRTDRELAEASNQVQRLERQLAGDFAHKAAPEAVQRERERLTEQRERHAALERRKQTLERLG
jgi:valyl-tRNA synthetase